MSQTKRSYYLPSKLVVAFDKEARKSGYVREKVVAAAICKFLDSDPAIRAQMFDRMASFLSKGK
ncbi:MAG TPA: hypothetical protein VLM89_04580 [Phycisphaerae bacterium]|nr:hypothetical protein [Phycisphaerae bacterium]